MKSTLSLPFKTLLETSAKTYHAFYAIETVKKGLQSLFDIPMIFFAGFLDGALNNQENIKNAQIGNDVRHILEQLEKLQKEEVRQEENIEAGQKEDERNITLFQSQLVKRDTPCLKKSQDNNWGTRSAIPAPKKQPNFFIRKKTKKYEFSPKSLITAEQREKIFKYPKLHNRLLAKYCSSNTVVSSIIKHSNKIGGTLYGSIFSIGQYLGKFLYKCKTYLMPQFLQNGIPRIIISGISCLFLMSIYVVIFGLKLVKSAIASLTDILLWIGMGLYDAALDNEHASSNEEGGERLNHGMILSDINHSFSRTFKSMWKNIKNNYNGILHHKVKSADSKSNFGREPQKGKSLVMRILSNEITHQLGMIRKEWSNMKEYNDDLEAQKTEVIELISKARSVQQELKQYQKKIKNNEGQANSSKVEIQRLEEELQQHNKALHEKLRGNKDLQNALGNEYDIQNYSTFFKHIEAFVDTTYTVTVKLSYDLGFTAYRWASLSRIPDNSETGMTPGNPNQL